MGERVKGSGVPLQEKYRNFSMQTYLSKAKEIKYGLLQKRGPYLTEYICKAENKNSYNPEPELLRREKPSGTEGVLDHVLMLDQDDINTSPSYHQFPKTLTL